ncbi:MAG TPA: ABC transporter ATP-binding protein [Rhodopila sp.]|jgi:oligopeptide/dipeptide ABC transporter ATP-binding protein
MNAAPPVLDVANLWVGYPSYRSETVHALRGINLQVAAGEIVGLVGESGSGKTTLARAVMGLVPEPGAIERGQVLFAGRNLAALDDAARRAVLGRELVMVIPNPRAELNPVLTAGRQISNVVLHHLGVGRREADRIALDMLRAVRIPDPERRFAAYPHELSGGMAQRVVIAIALVCSPRLVISDDATSGLDVTVQSQVLELLQTMVREKGAAALFITRDLAITAHFCTRIAVIYAGEIVEIATTRSFFRRPRHPYSIMLLAAFSHNPALRARWTRSQDAAGDAAVAGCSFAARCVRCRPLCLTEPPSLRAEAADHAVRCHFPVDTAA